MRTFLCRLHTEKLESMTMDDVLQVIGRMGFEWHEKIRHSENISHWIDIEVEWDNLYGMWQSLESNLLKSDTPGKEFSRALVITIPVDEAIDDYLVLHHFHRDQMLYYDERSKAIQNLASRT